MFRHEDYPSYAICPIGNEGSKDAAARVDNEIAQAVPEPVRVPPNKVAEWVRFGKWTGTYSKWACIGYTIKSLLKWVIKWAPGNPSNAPIQEQVAARARTGYSPNCPGPVMRPYSDTGVVV